MSKAIIARRLVFGFCIALLTFSLGLGTFLGLKAIKGVPHSNDLSLRLVLDNTVLRAGEGATIKLHVTNEGSETVTLVLPGDGSGSGWRTPIVRSSIIEAGDLRPHPASPEFPRTLRCGNINSLRWNEVFRLGPGETKVMDGWLDLPHFIKPGSYRVKFFYENRPRIQWLGMEMGIHNPIAMWRVRNSTECSLSSNEVLFTVTE